MRRSIRLTLGVAAAIALTLASVMTGKAGQDAVFADTSKIVAIGGSITEIVYALGEQEHLVARDSTSLYPPEALALPDVGYMRQLSPEGVLSVAPSGILALAGSGPKDALDVLKKARVAYVEVPETYDDAGILAKIRIVGHALGADAGAEALAANVAAQLKAAEDRTKDIARRKRVLFILSMQGGKVLAAGGDTAADGIIGMAGGVNAVEGFAGYKPLSNEAIATAAPDVILMMDHAGPAVLDDDLLASPAITATPAGKARRFLRMDGGYLLGFGPRTAAAVRDLAASLYGDAAAD